MLTVVFSVSVPYTQYSSYWPSVAKLGALIQRLTSCIMVGWAQSRVSAQAWARFIFWVSREIEASVRCLCLGLAATGSLHLRQVLALSHSPRQSAVSDHNQVVVPLRSRQSCQPACGRWPS